MSVCAQIFPALDRTIAHHLPKTHPMNPSLILAMLKRASPKIPKCQNNKMHVILERMVWQSPLSTCCLVPSLIERIDGIDQLAPSYSVNLSVRGTKYRQSTGTFVDIGNSSYSTHASMRQVPPQGFICLDSRLLYCCISARSLLSSIFPNSYSASLLLVLQRSMIRLVIRLMSMLPLDNPAMPLNYFTHSRWDNVNV